MPTTKKQKRTACAIAHGAKLKGVDLPLTVAQEMCKAPIKKSKRKK